MSSYIQESIRCQGSKLCCPFLSEQHGKIVLLYVSSGTGEIFSFADGRHTQVVYSGGEPFGARFDPHTGKLHIADCAHAAILKAADQVNAAPGIVVKVYEEKPFRV